jgi:hypothetical protein
LRNACVAGRFSQFVPSSSKRYGTASSRKPSSRGRARSAARRASPRDLGVLVVEVRLVVEEAVPVVGAALGSDVQFDCSVSTKMIRASS